MQVNKLTGKAARGMAAVCFDFVVKLLEIAESWSCSVVHDNCRISLGLVDTIRQYSECRRACLSGPGES